MEAERLSPEALPLPFPLVQVQEGGARILVPASAAAHGRGPSTSRLPVFYNPAMAFGRDVAVGVLRAFAAGRRDLRVLDGMAGCGVRGIRFELESSGDADIVLNDRNPLARRLTAENIALNRAGRCTAAGERLEALLLRERYDFIDLDPFGTPANHIRACIRALKRGGVLAATFTDTAPLCGTHPAACRRRYFSRPLRNECMHETALRIALHFCAREAALLGKGIRPLLCHATGHYLRVHVACDEGAAAADGALAAIGHAWFDRSSGARGFAVSGREIPEGASCAGPLWTGPLSDADFLGRVSFMGEKMERFLTLLREEAAAPPLHHTVEAVSERTGLPQPPIKELLERLRAAGYRATRTHITPTGFRTDAPPAAVAGAFRGEGSR